MLGFSAEIDHGYSWMTWGSASKFQKHMGIGFVATTLHFFGFWRVLNDHSMSSKPCVQLRMLRYPQGIPGQYDAMAINGQQWPHSRGTLVYTDHIHVKSRGFPSQPAVIMPRWGDLVLEFSADSPTKWANWRPQRAYLQACRSVWFVQPELAHAPDTSCLVASAEWPGPARECRTSQGKGSGMALLWSIWDIRVHRKKRGFFHPKCWWHQFLPSHRDFASIASMWSWVKNHLDEVSNFFMTKLWSELGPTSSIAGGVNEIPRQNSQLTVPPAEMSSVPKPDEPDDRWFHGPRASHCILARIQDLHRFAAPSTTVGFQIQPLNLRCSMVFIVVCLFLNLLIWQRFVVSQHGKISCWDESNAE